MNRSRNPTGPPGLAWYVMYVLVGALKTVQPVSLRHVWAGSYHFSHSELFAHTADAFGAPFPG